MEHTERHPEDMLDVSRLVRRFGGPVTLHARLRRGGYDITLKGIHAWVYRKQVPARWMVVLHRLAQEDKRPLQIENYMQTTPAAKRAQQAEEDERELRFLE